MAKPFKQIRNQLKRKVLVAAEKKAQKMLATMPLQDLRQARRLSQEQLAEALHVKQASISKLERRTDMYISTLRKFIQAMGGDLEIHAIFPDGEVSIEQFHKLSSAA